MSSLWFRFYYFLRTHKHSLKIFNGCTFQCLGGLENTPRNIFIRTKISTSMKHVSEILLCFM